MDQDSIALAVLLIPMLALPLLTIAIDKARRKTPAAKGEPPWPLLLALSVVVNVGVLAFYFDRTRGTVLARWAGFGLSILFIMLSFLGMTAVLLAKMS